MQEKNDDKNVIELSTMFTPYTLDCYQTFNFENAEESEIENHNEQHDAKMGYDDFEWDYDCKGYLKALAVNQIDLLNSNILDNVITKITANGEPWSPNQYNFATDEQCLQFTVNIENLNQYIKNNQAEYDKNKIDSYDGFMWFGDDDQTKLNYYLRTISAVKYEPYAYMIDQYDNVQAYEYITMTQKKAE